MRGFARELGCVVAVCESYFTLASQVDGCIPFFLFGPGNPFVASTFIVPVHKASWACDEHIAILAQYNGVEWTRLTNVFEWRLSILSILQ